MIKRSISLLLFIPFIFGDTKTKIISYTVDPKQKEVRLYWKDDSGHILRSIRQLKEYLGSQKKELVFATNAGMYKIDHSAVGLFIQQGKTITPLNTASASGNFYLKPNGVFYITKNKKVMICQTGDFINNDQIEFATQSGPMLVIDGVIHSAFKEGSENLNIRNGVGILPGNKLVFAMSEQPINFYDFAMFFKNLGCMNALYLDGFVSKTYLPEKNFIKRMGTLA